MESATLHVPPEMLDSLSRFVKTSRLPLEVLSRPPAAVQILPAARPRRCTMTRLYAGGFIACETARTLALRLGLRVGQMGKLLDYLHIKVRSCGLGCFK